MSSHLDVLGSTALVVLGVMVITWLISLVLRNAGIVDIVWGAGIIAITWTAAGVGDGHVDRSNLLVAMVTIWGLRLTGHLLWRDAGRGDDPRHPSTRRRAGDRFPMRSLVTVFLLHGALMWIVSLPVQLAMTPDEPDIGVLAVIGVVVWGIGFFLETVGDAQLARFRSDPANEGRVMDRGLWRRTRHPDHVGEACVWWGIFLVAAETADARPGVVGPIVMTLLLLRASGASRPERSLADHEPA